MASCSMRLFSANPILLIFLLTLLLKSSWAKMRRYELANLESVAIWNLSSCSSPKLLHGPSLHMLYTYGPCAPYKENLTFHKFLYEDQLRVDAIRKRTINEIIPGDAYGSSLISIDIGTPSTKVYLLFDTGSSLTWLRCKPRQSMNPEPRINYNRMESSTYKNVSYESDSCRALSVSANDGGNCLYEARYVTSTFSVGLLGQETLVVGPDMLADHKFGCSLREKGSLTRRRFDGILGANRGYNSFPSQTINKYGGVFSYCMPMNPGLTGSIMFGGYQSSSLEVQFTEMIMHPGRPSYYINLVGIGVGGGMLDMSPSELGDTVIDSGAAISRLPPNAYGTLRNKFVEGMEVLGFRPQTVDRFDACFKTSDKPLDVPAISLHFGGGATISLGPAGILVGVEADTYCLAFVADKDLRILGYRQQIGIETIYDIPNSRIGFGKC